MTTRRSLLSGVQGIARRALPYVLLTTTLWAVRYWHSAAFGLYEDDLTIIPRAVTLPWPDLLRYVASYIAHLYGHARPLSDSFIYLFSHLGWKVAGMWGPYWIGFAIEALNVGLFVALLKRVQGLPLALVGGMAYVLYSADTTQAFLNHSLGLQPSITLLLLASHAYLSGKRFAAYLLAFVILFSYETPFTVFVGVPLLMAPWDRRWLRQLLGHGLVVGMMLAAVFAFRAVLGEGRIAGLGLGEMVTIPLIHMVQGPAVSLGTYLYRPLQTLQAMNAEVAVTSVVFFGIVVWIAERTGREVARWGNLSLHPAGAGMQGLGGALPRARAIWMGLPQEIQCLLRLAAAGLVMLILAYPLTFTVRAYAISGRETRVHTAGVVGAAVLIGSLLLLAIGLAQTLGRRHWASVAVGVWLGLLAGYGFVVQRDYVLAWRYQRGFWTQLLPLIPDVGNGTAVLLDPEGVSDTRQIGANTWNLPRVLDQLYVFPSEWETPPRVFRLLPGWQDRIVSESGLFQLNGATTTAPEPLLDRYPSANVILIETGGGRLTRWTGVLEIPGGIFQLRRLGEPVLPFLHTGFLFPLLIEGVHP